MAKQTRQRDNSRYREETGPLGERSYEANDTRMGMLVSVPMADLKRLGLVPEWNPSAFISNESFKSPRGRYAFLRGEDIDVFRSVYEQSTGTAMKTHPKGNDYPLHVERLIPIHDEVVQRDVPGLPDVIPYSCDESVSNATDVAVYNPILQSITDFVMYAVLCDIVNNHAVQGPKMLETKYLMLRTWIRAKTPALSGIFYDDKTRMMWVYQFRTSFPVCPTCHREFGRLKNIHLSKTYVAYQPHCSSSCARRDHYVDAEYKAACMRHYGVDHPSKAIEVRQKTRDTLIKRYGVICVLNLEEFKEKAKMTSRRKYGTDYPAQNPDIYNKLKNTMRRRYGVENSMMLPEVRDKAKASLLRRYGVESPLQNKEIMARVENTTMKRYGVKHVTQDPDFVARSIRSRIRNQKLDKKPKMDGLVFDSRWELIFYAYCKDHGLDVVYHPCRLEYVYCGVKHYYYPDFKVGDKLYEIKGDCFINPDGTWRCPFRKKGSTDEEFAFACGQIEAKRRCVVDNGIIVVSRKEIKNLDHILI